MKLSVCIPNYNYEDYLTRTIQSVLDQGADNCEIVVSDNASTDGSIRVIQRFADPRVRWSVNNRNVGFAGNLDRAVRLASGDWILLLSSDDVMHGDAAETYSRFFESLGSNAKNCFISATCDVIDSDDSLIGVNGPDKLLWRERDRRPDLDAIVNGPVYEADADDLLRRCLLLMRNPFNFASTCYPRSLYDRVEGYGLGRSINPDKWFHWKLLTVADKAYFIDRPLVSYRWHARNQTAQQAATGALKYPVDEYLSTLDIEDTVLERLGLNRLALVEAFVEHDIARHGLATLGRGYRVKARRLMRFGQAVYPDQMRKNANAWILRALLLFGPVGEIAARIAYKIHGGRSIGLTYDMDS